MKLGRKPSPPAKRALTLGLSNYMEVLKPPPDKLDLTPGIPAWPMFANDRLGDCTCVSIGHMLEVFTYQVDGTPRVVSDDDVIALYNLVNDGVDQGADMLRVLDACRRIGVAGDKILAYVDVRVGDLNLIKTGCWLFSGLYIGVNLPLTAQMQTGQGPWSVVPEAGHQAQAGSWGGHAVNVVGYDSDTLTVVTWGALQKMTWDFWRSYVDESYVLLPQAYDRLAGKPLANGFNEDQLRTDLAQFGPVS